MAVLYVTPDEEKRAQELADQYREEGYRWVRERAPDISEDDLEFAIEQWWLFVRLDEGHTAFQRALVAAAVADWLLAAGHIEGSDRQAVAWDVYGSTELASRPGPSLEEHRVRVLRAKGITARYPNLGEMMDAGFEFYDKIENSILGPPPNRALEGSGQTT